MDSSIKIWNKKSALMRLGGDEQLLSQLVELFLNGYEEKFGIIKKLLLSSDNSQLTDSQRESLRQISHKFKGNCLNIGANRMFYFLEELEKNALTASEENLVTTAEHVQEELPKLVDALKS